MRRHRPFPIYWSAILTVLVGVAAVPATALAEGDDVAPADGTAPPADPAPAAPTPPASSEPAPPTTESEPVDSGDTPPPSSTPAAGDAVASPEPTSPAADPAASTPAAAPRVAPGDATSDASTSEPSGEPTPGNDELQQDAFAALPDGVVRPISFPVLGPVRYANGWGNCRDGCTRRHVGTDLMGVAMQPLLAAVDGTITRIRYENVSTAGAVITITGADGWYYNYFHVNDDSPGTHDGAASPEWQVSPQLTVGSPVHAGQVIGYMGDSGNAQGAPHLHFEIRQPDRTPVNPYPSLAAAEQSPTCDDTATWLDPTTVSPAAVAIIPLDGGGRWLIDRDGHLYAEGSAASVHAAPGTDCTPTEPIVDAVDVPAVAPDSPAEAVVPVAAQQPVAEPAPVPRSAAEPAPEPQPVAEPAPEPPTVTTWAVRRGQSLWQIVQEAYGVSDVASTVSLVDLVFEHNRAQLTDPNLLNVGTELLLPAI